MKYWMDELQEKKIKKKTAYIFNDRLIVFISSNLYKYQPNTMFSLFKGYATVVGQYIYQLTIGAIFHPVNSH